MEMEQKWKENPLEVPLVKEQKLVVLVVERKSTSPWS